MLGGSIIKCLWLIMKPVLETLLIILAVVSVRSKLSPQGNLRRSNGGMMQQPERVNKKLGMRHAVVDVVVLAFDPWNNMGSIYHSVLEWYLNSDF